MAKICVVVDGYSSGAGFAPCLMQLGYKLIHVQSQAQVPAVYQHTYRERDYDYHYIFNGDLDGLISQLSLFDIDFIIAGAELGINLADQLAFILGLPCNDIKLSEARRDKYAMVKAIERKGLRSIGSEFVDNLNALHHAVAKLKTWPLVIKPLNSAGGEGVVICENESALIAAYVAIMSKSKNMLGFQNRGAIVQQYIEGEELVINTVSLNGQHKLCEIWRYTRIALGKYQKIYDTAQLVPFDAKAHDEFIQYAFSCLDALGVSNGPAHVELMVNAQGCFLIEAGARLMGANLPFSLLNRSVTTSQAQQTLLVYTQPQQFKQNFSSSYVVVQPLAAVFLRSQQYGVVSGITHLDKVKQLPSFFAINLAIHDGDHINQTIDYETCPGMIYLSHPDERQIQQDIDNIRIIEQTLFEVVHHDHDELVVHE